MIIEQKHGDDTEYWKVSSVMLSRPQLKGRSILTIQGVGHTDEFGNGAPIELVYENHDEAKKHRDAILNFMQNNTIVERFGLRKALDAYVERRKDNEEEDRGPRGRQDR